VRRDKAELFIGCEPHPTTAPAGSTVAPPVADRLRPGGAILIIGHRMHEDELQGRLIERMKAGDGADQWTIIRLPAVAEGLMSSFQSPPPSGAYQGGPCGPPPIRSRRSTASA
jgi:hypothetical protein